MSFLGPSLGRVKSGRKWKQLAHPSSAKIQTKGVKGHTWNEKVVRRQEELQTRQKLGDLRAAKQGRQDEARQKRLDKKRRREENEKKSVQCQAITSSKRIKRMSLKEKKKLKAGSQVVSDL